MLLVGGIHNKYSSHVTHEICQGVKLRAHQAALASPSRDHAVKEIEK